MSACDPRVRLLASQLLTEQLPHLSVADVKVYQQWLARQIQVSVDDFMRCYGTMPISGTKPVSAVVVRSSGHD